jgi:hypothetical protein
MPPDKRPDVQPISDEAVSPAPSLEGTTTEPAATSWVSGITNKVGDYVADHPGKSTVALVIIAGQVEKRIVEPSIGWLWGKGVALFAAGAEKTVDEAVSEEAVANAIGGFNPLNIFSKAFGKIIK